MIFSLLLSLAATARPQQPLQLEEVARGLRAPVYAASAPGDDASRIFVLSHRGQIGILENGQPLPQTFLDLSSVQLLGVEDGAHGFAFHPDYAQNRRFYVTYSDLNGDWTLAEYLRDPANPNLADPNSARLLLVIPHPFTVHYGGWLEFGNDGYLWVSVGDGGDQGDPMNHAQRGDVLLGKLLRLDVDHPAPGLEYGIPPTNPFVNDSNVRDEIWALGLRNPWRCDYDESTGDLWIGDVGQNTWEEVDFLPAGVAGANFGWRLMEGNHCFDPPANCNPNGDLTLPVHEWIHGGVPYRCAVIGGLVYRGSAMADMHGRFFFADYCSGEIWSMRWDGSGIVDFQDHSPELYPGFSGPPQITGFGADADGELYVLDTAAGAVLRIVPAGLRLRVPQLMAGQSAPLAVSGGTANAVVGVAYSLSGLGSTPVPPLNVTLGIAQASLLVQGVTNGAGAASFPIQVPAAGFGRTVWFQAAQFNARSNVMIEFVE